MKIDAEIGVHKNSPGLELLPALYLIQNTTVEMGERTPKCLFQHGRGIAIQLNLQTGIPWPIFLCT